MRFSRAFHCLLLKRGVLLKLALCLFYIFSSIICEAKDVVVLGTLHDEHNRLPLYTFDTIKIVLEHIKPDLLLIEEDIETFRKNATLTDIEYAANRPIEIRKVLLPYAEKHKVEIIPTDSRIEYDKKMDSVYSKIDDSTEKAKSIQYAYMALFNEDYLHRSIYDFHDNFSMSVIEGRNLLMKNTPQYREVLQLEEKRQSSINKNILKILKSTKAKKICIVYGLTHRPSIMRAVSNAGYNILPLRQAMEPQIISNFSKNR